MDTLVWSIAHDGRIAAVGEDGSVDGDDDLAALLRTHLSEPVTVYRHGTLPGPGTAPRDAIELRPGDGRYVVARIRVLCATDPYFEIVDCTWRETPP